MYVCVLTYMHKIYILAFLMNNFLHIFKHLTIVIVIVRIVIVIIIPMEFLDNNSKITYHFD